MAHSHTPLTNAQKVVTSGQVLPSGEANFYDLLQNPKFNQTRTTHSPGYTDFKNGSGIIASYQSPADFVDSSGTIALSGAKGAIVEKSSLGTYNGLQSGPPQVNAQFKFSNAIDHQPKRLDETIQGGATATDFNTYVHYYGTTTQRGSFDKEIEIPYVSTLTLVESEDLEDPYPSTFTLDGN